jgi:hypothetical protein
MGILGFVQNFYVAELCDFSVIPNYMGAFQHFRTWFQHAYNDTYGTDLAGSMCSSGLILQLQGINNIFIAVSSY